MGSIIDGIASIFGGGPKVAAVTQAPTQTIAATPEGQGATLSESEMNRQKDAISKKKTGTKALQIPLVGTNASTATTPVGANTGTGGV